MSDPCVKTQVTKQEMKCDNGVWKSRTLAKYVCNAGSGGTQWIEWRPDSGWVEDGGACSASDITATPTGNTQVSLASGQSQTQAEFEYQAVNTPQGTVTWLVWQDET